MGDFPWSIPPPLCHQGENGGSERSTNLPQVGEPVTELSQQGRALDSQLSDVSHSQRLLGRMNGWVSGWVNGKAWLLRWSYGLASFVDTVGMSISSFSVMYCFLEIGIHFAPFLSTVSPHRLQRRGRIHPRSPTNLGQGQDGKPGVPWAPTPHLSLPELKMTSIHFTGKETGDRPRGGARRITGWALNQAWQDTVCNAFLLAGAAFVAPVGLGSPQSYVTPN